MKILEFARWGLEHFTTEVHFKRFLATWIIGVGAHDAIRHGKIEDSVLVLVGGVIAYYFKEQNGCKCSEKGGHHQHAEEKPASGHEGHHT